jgi:hypothetical protein
LGKTQEVRTLRIADWKKGRGTEASYDFRRLKNSTFTQFDKLSAGFDILRANGSELENVEVLPFVLSLSKYESPFSAPC